MDRQEKLARLSLPVAIVHGARDNVVPPQMVQR